MYFHL